MKKTEKYFDLVETDFKEVKKPLEESGDEDLFETLLKNQNRIDKNNNAKGKKFYIRESYHYLKIKALPESEALLTIMKKKLPSYHIKNLDLERL